MRWEGKNALSFFYFRRRRRRLLLLPADSPGGSDFSRAPRVLFWLIFRLVRPIFTFLFSMSFSCFSPLWRCDAFRLSSPRFATAANDRGDATRSRQSAPPFFNSFREIRTIKQFLGVAFTDLPCSSRVGSSRLFPRLCFSSVQFSSVGHRALW